MKTIHEHIDQYEMDLDARYAHEKERIAQLRKVLAASTENGPLPEFAFGATGDRGRRLGQKSTAKAKVRDSSKTADVIALLKQSGGASMAEIASATGWKDSSIRGFLSGVLTKKMGLPVQSMKTNNERRYMITS